MAFAGSHRGQGDLRHLFLAVAVGIIGFWLVEGGSGGLPAFGIALAIALGIFLMGLVFGLGVAFYQALSKKPRTIGQGRILQRYGLDDKLQRVDAHPCPAADGLVPMVEVELLTGEIVILQASPSAYDLSKPGLMGKIIGTRKRLTGFKPLR